MRCARSATPVTTCCSSPSRATATLAGDALAAGSAALLLEGEEATLEAGADGISLVRVTLGAATDLHAPMGPRERIVEIDHVEPGKATGSRSFQVLFGPHNGSTRATMFVGYVPPGKAPWHYHLYDEIVWIWRGPGRYHLGDDVEPLENGSRLPDHAARGAHRREHEPRSRARDARHLHAGREPVGRVPDAGRRGDATRSGRRERRGASDRPKARVGDAIRGEFPIFEHKTYLNSCSQGALSHRVRAAYEEYLAGWDENGAEWEFWVERAEAARAGFAALLHGQPDEVAVTTSVSQGVSGIVSALPFERGGRNRIVISDYEFPTVGQIAHAQELRGAEVVHVRPEADGSIPAEKFAEAIDERTALVCCTTISYRTGHRHDVAAIAEAAHAHGALVLADSYQAVGRDRARRADARRRLRHRRDGQVPARLAPASASSGCAARCSPGLMPTQTGWFADEDIFQMDISDYSPHATARRFDAGTPPVPNIYAGVAGLGLLAGDRRSGDRGARLGAEHAADRRPPRARRRRRHPGRPGASRAARLRALDRCARRSSPRSPRRTSSARCATRTCASRRTSTTPTTTSTRCSRRSRAVATCSPDKVALSHKLPPARQIAYGDHPDQVGNLHLPAGAKGPGRRSS